MVSLFQIEIDRSIRLLEPFRADGARAWCLVSRGCASGHKQTNRNCFFRRRASL